LARRTVSEAEYSELAALALRRKTAQALALRAGTVLACADGAENKDVRRVLGWAHDSEQMAPPLCREPPGRSACPRHHATEFRRVLDEIEANVPDDLDIHLVMDHYTTQKTPMIGNWLAKRPRWHVHLTPTGCSLINQVERFCLAHPPVTTVNVV
jgi:hypothetical protein